MDKKIGLNDKITLSKGKTVAVSELLQNKGEIFKLIKNGYTFNDEVLELAGIKRNVRDKRTRNEFVEHEKEKNKAFPKETESIKNILKSIHTLEGDDFGDFSEEENVDININDENYD